MSLLTKVLSVAAAAVLAGSLAVAPAHAGPVEISPPGANDWSCKPTRRASVSGHPGAWNLREHGQELVHPLAVPQERRVLRLRPQLRRDERRVCHRAGGRFGAGTRPVRGRGACCHRRQEGGSGGPQPGRHDAPLLHGLSRRRQECPSAHRASHPPTTAPKA